jgi:hypothetical protein
MIAGAGSARGTTGAVVGAAVAVAVAGVSPFVSAGGGTEPRGGAGCDSRRGFGGGASLRAPPGGTESLPLPGSDAGAGIGDARMRGRLGAPGGGLLGVPTGTTGTLGILGGGGMLSEVVLAPSAVTSASSIVEISGFEVMPA